MQTAKYDVIVRFVAETAGRGEIAKVIEEHFGATDILISIERRTPAQSREWPRPGTCEAEILQIIRDRGVLRSAEFGGSPNGLRALRRLHDNGLIVRLRKGIYKLRSLDAAAGKNTPDAVPPSRRQQQVLDRLRAPMTLVELSLAAGVSKQAMHGRLKKLERDGLVVRSERKADNGDQLYCRASPGQAPDTQRTDELSEDQCRLLDLMPLQGCARVKDLENLVGSRAGPALRALHVLEMIEYLGPPKNRLVFLTPKGAANRPTREESVLSAVDAASAYKPWFIGILETLSRLGEARAADLTTAANVTRKGNVGIGQYLQQLRNRGFIGQLTTLNGGPPSYVVTLKGRQLLNAIRRSKGLAELSEPETERPAPQS